MGEVLALVEGTQGEEIFRKVEQFIESFHSGMSPIQINRFVLNDVEFPTPYGKYVQAKAELIGRYYRLADLYFDAEKTRLEAELEEDRAKCHSGRQAELHELEARRLRFKLASLRGQVKAIIKEAEAFFEVYKAHAHFDELSEEEKGSLEWKQWKEKTLNDPLIFEQRYGERYMQDQFGAHCYEQMRALRMNHNMILPRELFRATLLQKPLPESEPEGVPEVEPEPLPESSRDD